MSWWRWGLVGLAAAVFFAGVGYLTGGLVERGRASQARLAIIAEQLRADRAHASVVARLEERIAARDTTIRDLVTAARASDARADAAERTTNATRARLALAMTAADSLASYVPLVAALTEEVAAERSAADRYREALAASVARSGLLLERIRQDSVLIERQRVTIAGLAQPRPAGGGLGRAAETAALAAATAGACQRGVLTVGCVAGAVATGRRLSK